MYERERERIYEPPAPELSFEVPCSHPAAKGGILHAVPERYNWTHSEYGQTFIMADVDKLLEMIEKTDPHMMDHARRKYRGESAENWLRHNSERQPLDTGSFYYKRRKVASSFTANLLQSVFGINASAFSQKSEKPIFSMMSGHAGTLILMKELGIKQIPIGVQANNRQEMLEIVNKIGFGQAPIIREQKKYPEWGRAEPTFP